MKFKSFESCASIVVTQMPIVWRLQLIFEYSKLKLFDFNHIISLIIMCIYVGTKFIDSASADYRKKAQRGTYQI